MLARLGAPFDPWSARYLAPDEGTLREAFARVDPGALSAAGFGRLRALIPAAPDRLAPAASHEIGEKTNEIPEFAPLVSQLADADVTDALFTMDALHAQRDHADYLVEDRRAHYLVTIKDNRPTLARQLRALPWKQVPVLDRSTGRGHGREEQRLV